VTIRRWFVQLDRSGPKVFVAIEIGSVELRREEMNAWRSKPSSIFAIESFHLRKSRRSVHRENCAVRTEMKNETRPRVKMKKTRWHS